MHFTGISAIAIAVLSSTGLAAPAYEVWPPAATIQISNDHSGAHANVAVPADGVTRSVQELWGHTPVNFEGKVFGSSAQLIAFEQTTVCTFSEEPHLHSALTASRNWIQLGKPVVDLCFATVVCERNA
ncbi:hypothetical protein N7478_012135 [Penicillium angulare]|uniref:uncharacterized protein n=1 Tax=Penicillium angulare TaxID=116970 RepID=UPI0025422C1B|nr:uncharacterized protein N7478_012135 [Penicillium angulare]KAJ5260530.1 hypothetical protein N7478_012135 [Penicillium angulare]